jgi:hypothetical protein
MSVTSYTNDTISDNNRSKIEELLKYNILAFSKELLIRNHMMVSLQKCFGLLLYFI